MLISGCSSNVELYKAANGKILCEFNAPIAYTVTDAIGDLSLIKRDNRLDILCPQPKENSE